MAKSGNTRGQSDLEKFKAWHKSTPGLAISGLAELLLAYIVGSRAIDTGSWWEYGFTLVLLIGGIQNIVRLLRKSSKSSRKK